MLAHLLASSRSHSAKLLQLSRRVGTRRQLSLSSLVDFDVTRTAASRITQRTQMWKPLTARGALTSTSLIRRQLWSRSSSTGSVPRMSLQSHRAVCLSVRQASTKAAISKRRVSLKTVLFRCVWVPYFILAFIPHTFLALTLYNFARGNKAKARGWAFYTVTGYVCLPLSLCVNAALPFVYLFDWDRRMFYNYMTKLWGKMTTCPFIVPEIRGAELIPRDGRPIVFVSNHQSWLDIFCFCWLPDDVILRFISKIQIAYIPVVGWSMALLGHVLFDRATGGRQLLKDCASLLEKGIPVFFFPEGTRSRDPTQLLPFKAGAFKLAKDAEATIVPISIVGTGAIMRIGHETELDLDQDASGKSPRVVITVHEPIVVKAEDTVESLREASADVIQTGIRTAALS